MDINSVLFVCLMTWVYYKAPAVVMRVLFSCLDADRLQDHGGESMVVLGLVASS